MKELPSFQQSYEDHAGAFEILSVGSEVNDPTAPEYVAEKGYSWPFVNSKEGVNNYGANGIPMTLFLDADGNIIEEVLGGMDHATFERHLAKII